MLPIWTTRVIRNILKLSNNTTLILSKLKSLMDYYKKTASPIVWNLLFLLSILPIYSSMKIWVFISSTCLLCPLNADCMVNRATYALSIFIRQYQHIPQVINIPQYPHAKRLGMYHYISCNNIKPSIFKGTFVFQNKMWYFSWNWMAEWTVHHNEKA